MRSDRSGLIIVTVFVAFFVGLYVVTSYNSLFDRRLTYLYDPKSDDVYAVKLAPLVHKVNKWDPFIPFQSLSFAEPEDAEYVGKLHQLIAEFEADMALLKSDPDAWSKKFDKEFEMALEEAKNSDKTWKAWYVDYFARFDVEAHTLLEPTFWRIFDGMELEKDEVIVVDAVVTNRTISMVAPYSRTPPEVKVLEKAILFKGAAVVILVDKLGSG